LSKAILISIIYLITAAILNDLFGQSSNLAIDGALKISSSSSDPAQPGTIRFNAETNDFEGWNGLYWISITGFQYDVGSVTDVHGNVYATIKIGDQEWMAENLRVTQFRNGDAIVQVFDDLAWAIADYPGYCWYNFDPSLEGTHGLLYNWYAAGDSRGICPTGWRLPKDDVANNDSDWQDLREYLGVSDHGPKLREAGFIHWKDTNNGTNSSGFTARGSGQRRSNGTYALLNERVFFWSDRENGTDAFSVSMTAINNLGPALTSKNYGYSIRCIKE